MKFKQNCGWFPHQETCHAYLGVLIGIAPVSKCLALWSLKGYLLSLVYSSFLVYCLSQLLNKRFDLCSLNIFIPIHNFSLDSYTWSQLSSDRRVTTGMLAIQMKCQASSFVPQEPKSPTVPAPLCSSVGLDLSMTSPRPCSVIQANFSIFKASLVYNTDLDLIYCKLNF